MALRDDGGAGGGGGVVGKRGEVCSGGLDVANLRACFSVWSCASVHAPRVKL